MPWYENVSIIMLCGLIPTPRIPKIPEMFQSWETRREDFYVMFSCPVISVSRLVVVTLLFGYVSECSSAVVTVVKSPCLLFKSPVMMVLSCHCLSINIMPVSI